MLQNAWDSPVTVKTKLVTAIPRVKSPLTLLPIAARPKFGADRARSILSTEASQLRRAVRRFTSRRRPLVCIGHSHTKCVAAAAAGRGIELRSIDFWGYPNPVQRENGTSRFRAEIERQLEGTIFSMVGGSAYNMMGLVVHPRRFDFILPDSPDLPFDARAELVPYDAVRAGLAAITQEYLDLMAIIRATGKGPVFHIEAPPPYPDGDRMLADVPWMFFSGMEREVSPRYLRYKLWRLHSDIVREFCERMGMSFVACPPEAVDAEGFLLPAYYQDTMHVNAAYGALVLRQMQEVA